MMTTEGEVNALIRGQERVELEEIVTYEPFLVAKVASVEEEKEETDRWKEWLENLKPEDFGKYKM